MMDSRSLLAAALLVSVTLLISSTSFHLSPSGDNRRMPSQRLLGRDPCFSRGRRSFVFQTVASLIGAFSLFCPIPAAASRQSLEMNLMAPTHQAFYSNLFTALCQENPGENVLVSPFSIAQSLAMVAAGATPKSKCESELLQALGISSTNEVARSLKAVSPGTKNTEDGVALTTANSIWSKDLKKDYIRQVQKEHGAAAKELPSTYEPIDRWISDSTKGLLSNVMGKDPIDPLVVGLLVNAVHFKGSWAKQFDAGRNTKGTFHTANNERQLDDATYMHAQRKMAVAASLPHLGKATALRLDYGTSKKSGDIAAVLLLPEDNTSESMASMMKGLEAPESVATTLSSLKAMPREVDLSLPRFRIEWGASSLKKCLRRLGINLAFDGGRTGSADADDVVFSRMTSDPTVHLDDVIHKAVMEVTEEGTVAAAATVAVMKARSMVMPAPPLVLEFNRPFVMMVVHAATSTPLFMAKVATPNLSF